MLTEFIPKMALAKTKDAHQRSYRTDRQNYRHTRESVECTANIASSAGMCQVPVTTRFIENRASRQRIWIQCRDRQPD